MKSKLVVLVLSVVLVAGLVVTGCAPEAAVPDAEEEAQAPEEEEEQVVPAAPAAEAINWAGQSHNQPGEPYYENFARVCEDISLASGGRLNIEPFAGGSIVPKTKEFDGLDTGVLDCAQNCPMYWMEHIPTGGIFTYVVGGLSPVEFLGWLYDGGGAGFLNEAIADYNVYAIPASGLISTPEVFLHSATPIEKSSDFKGLKIRGAGDGAEVLNRMGASMVFFSHLEIYESMQRGVIDAFECSNPTNEWAVGLNEVGEHVYLSGVRQPMEYLPFTVCRESWEALPDDLKCLVERISQQAAIRLYSQMLVSDAENLAKFVDYGCDVQFLSTEIENDFAVAAEEFYAEKCSDDLFYAGVYESQQAYKKAVRMTFPRL